MTLEQAHAIIAAAGKKHSLALKQLQRAQRAETPAVVLRLLTDSMYVSKLKTRAERELEAVEYWQAVVANKTYTVYDFAYFGKAYKLNG